jgi:hypothetical protein
LIDLSHNRSIEDLTITKFVMQRCALCRIIFKMTTKEKNA